MKTLAAAILALGIAALVDRQVNDFSLHDCSLKHRDRHKKGFLSR
jgi:hypothetical protein